MSDYMFMLENHLNADQSRVVAAVADAAAQANVNLFLTGGAVRDMLGGFPIRDLDFTAEGNGLKLARTVAQKTGAKIISEDDHRKRAELLFPGGVTAEIGMARSERFPKPGGKPQVAPVTIHEDLRGRDFTINALALSLNRASRGLLLDPTNGLSDLERKELRATGNYTLYDDPIRLLRMIRFRVRLGYQIAERTQSQYENARESQVEKYVAPRALYEELRRLAGEMNQAEILEELAKEKLLELISPVLAGPKLNTQGFAKLHKARQLIPFGIDVKADYPALFFNLLTEKLSAKEEAALVRAIAAGKSEVAAWQKLEQRAKKLERELKSPKLQKSSQVYAAMAKAPGEDLLFLLVKSQERLVVDRIKNYFQKYLVTANEVTDQEVAATGLKPGTPKFLKKKEEMIAARLDARPKKVAPPPAPEPPPPAASGPGRRRIQ